VSDAAGRTGAAAERWASPGAPRASPAPPNAAPTRCEALADGAADARSAPLAVGGRRRASRWPDERCEEAVTGGADAVAAAATNGAASSRRVIDAARFSGSGSEPPARTRPALRAVRSSSAASSVMLAGRDVRTGMRPNEGAAANATPPTTTAAPIHHIADDRCTTPPKGLYCFGARPPRHYGNAARNIPPESPRRRDVIAAPPLAIGRERVLHCRVPALAADTSPHQCCRRATVELA
jgi:hypothetical protein